MDPLCLQYLLTEEERQRFQQQGFLVIPEALDRSTNERLIAAVDRVDARERALATPRDRLLSFANILPEDDAFLDLIDWPKIFPKVWGILGWNIYVYHSHLDVTPNVLPQLLAAMKPLGEGTAKENGLVTYQILRQTAGARNHFRLFEIWSNEAAWEAHNMSAHSQTFRDALYPMLGTPYDQRKYQLVN